MLATRTSSAALQTIESAAGSEIGPIAAIVLWNTIYIERAVRTLRERGQAISDDLLAHLSPLGWEHINLTGDYVWKPDSGTKQRPLRQLRLPISADESNP